MDFIGLLQQSSDTLNSSESFSNAFDLEPDEELWKPEGISYYAGELVLQSQQHWTRDEQLELLETHPIFTGRCPDCHRPFPQDAKAPVHWDCQCGWMDDTV